MRKPPPTFPPGQADPMLVHRLLYVQRVFLAAVLIVALSAFIAYFYPAFGAYPLLAYVRMSPATSLAAVFCALGLLMSEPGNPGFLVLQGRIFAALAGFLSLALLAERFMQWRVLPRELVDPASSHAISNALSPQAAAGFLSIAVVMVFVGSENVVVQHVADVLVIFQGLLALTLLSQSVFGTLDLFGVTRANHLSPQILFCFLLLTAVVEIRQADCGILTIFLGHGIGSRIARPFALILLLWPYLGRIVETHLSLGPYVPANFVASFLTSIEVVLFLALLLILVWRITEMETEIHDLTLRDELTGLYNMRGFYLLADQTYRLAKRGGLPFSVLFLDLDGLKKINDRLGHSVGSAYLAETGEIVGANFRDGDVKGRFGGDEFVVAGQFSIVGIEVSAQRLKATAAERNAKEGRQYPLSFSIGYVTVEYHSTETLDELVARADQMMYKDKQSKYAART